MVEKNCLELKNISFFYKKDKLILKNLSFKIYSGTITALLGINGSGKTTLFKILTRIHDNFSGEMLYNNNVINKNNILEYKSKIGFMPENLQMYKNLTVKSLLELLADLKGYKNLDINGILDSVFLIEHSDKKIHMLSKGMKQRLNLAQSIMGNPDIILFDEPSNGFDCGSISIFYTLLKRMVNRGATILLSSHHLTEIYGNVDRVLILSEGKIIKDININLNSESNEFFLKEVFILLNNDLNKNILSILFNNFIGLKIKNKNLLFGIFNIKTILLLILELTKLNLIIKDIKIEEKILEKLLINLT